MESTAGKGKGVEAQKWGRDRRSHSMLTETDRVGVSASALENIFSVPSHVFGVGPQVNLRRNARL